MLNAGTHGAYLQRNPNGRKPRELRRLVKLLALCGEHFEVRTSFDGVPYVGKGSFTGHRSVIWVHRKRRFQLVHPPTLGREFVRSGTEAAAYLLLGPKAER